MRKLIVAFLTTSLAMVGVGTAAADLGRPTARVVRQRACGDVGGLGAAEHHCDDTRQDTRAAEGLLVDAACGDIGDLGVAEHHCDETRQDIRAVTGLVNAAACTDAGADLDCRGYEHDAEHLERDAARLGNRALNDAGL